ncbi:hypothetical protein AMS68_005964 [Peltaster fructicola]|uniref:Chromo domain-containing protein n=1 Tax=Peltaster fructicola TaxID=286661 RepID=A0A6H0Y0B8_9PEZI|nr:hypothetical protein AMS68_005964 [Peltaster fructicola]
MKQPLSKEYSVSHLSHRDDRLEAIIGESTDDQNRKLLLAKWEGHPTWRATWELEWRFTKDQRDSWATQKRRLEAIERFVDEDGDEIMDHMEEPYSCVRDEPFESTPPASITAKRTKTVVKNSLTGLPAVLLDGSVLAEEDAASILLQLCAADSTMQVEDKNCPTDIAGVNGHQAIIESDQQDVKRVPEPLPTQQAVHANPAFDYAQNELDCASAMCLLSQYPRAT